MVFGSMCLFFNVSFDWIDGLLLGMIWYLGERINATFTRDFEVSYLGADCRVTDTVQERAMKARHPPLRSQLQRRRSFLNERRQRSKKRLPTLQYICDLQSWSSEQMLRWQL